jgi:hypothetical protein
LLKEEAEVMAKEKAVAKMRGQGGEVEVEEEKRRNSASTRNTKGLNCELTVACISR